MTAYTEACARVRAHTHKHTHTHTHTHKYTRARHCNLINLIFSFTLESRLEFFQHKVLQTKQDKFAAHIPIPNVFHSLIC